MNNLERHLGTRFLLNQKKQGAISVATLTAILGLALGVGALLVVLSVTSGFQKEYKRTLLSFNSHLILLKSDGMDDPEAVAARVLEKSKSLTPIVGWTPFLYREGMLIHDGKVKGIVVKGVDFERYREISKMNIVEAPWGVGKNPKLYLGRDLANEFFSEKKSRGNDARILFPPRRLGRFSVAGSFQSGLYEYDSSFAFMALKDAQKFFGLGHHVTGIEFWLHDPERADEWIRALEEEFRYPYLLMSWRDLNENIFRALELEKVVFFVLMLVLIVIASLNVLGTLVMLILERSKEIAILRVLGMPWKHLRRIFLWEGLVIGFLGTAIGILLGLGFLYAIGHTPIPLAPEVYFVKTVPIFYSWRNFFWVSATGLLVVFLGCELTLWVVRRIPILRTLVG